jgi:hypothetical protein
VWGILYKLSLLHKPELNKVYHYFYKFVLGRIQGVKLGGVSENTLSNIIYGIMPRSEEKPNGYQI